MLAVAAPTRASPSSSSPRRRSTARTSAARRRDGDLEAALAEVEALAPEHLVLLGDDAEALAPRVRNAGAVFVGASSPVAAGDYATGGNHVLPTGGWARAVGGLGLETFLQAGDRPAADAGGARARAAGRRGARGGRGHARARGGGAAMRALRPDVRGLRLGAVDGRARAPRGLDPSRSSASTATSPPQPLPSARPGTIAGALAASTRTRTAATRSCSARSRATPASSRRTSCSAPAPTT